MSRRSASDKSRRQIRQVVSASAEQYQSRTAQNNGCHDRSPVYRSERYASTPRRTTSIFAKLATLHPHKENCTRPTPAHAPRPARTDNRTAHRRRQEITPPRELCHPQAATLPPCHYPNRTRGQHRDIDLSHHMPRIVTELPNNGTTYAAPFKCSEQAATARLCAV